LEKLAYLAFAIIGVAGTIPGITMPFFIEKFQLPFSVAGLLLFAAAAGYLAASFYYPALLKRFAAGQLLPAAFVVIAIGFAFTPWQPIWFLVVLLGFVANLGSGTIEVGFNTLIAQLEPKRSEVAMNWLHFSYGLGALLGPLLLSRLFNLSGSWFVYHLSIAFLSLIFLVIWHRFKTMNKIAPNPKPAAEALNGIYKNRSLWALIALMFTYVAAEVSLAGWAPTFLIQLGAGSENAALGVSVIWLGVTLGRALCTKLVAFLRPKPLLLLLTAGTGLSMLALNLTDSVYQMFAGLFITGLFFSAIFPLIILYGSQLFPDHTPQTTSSLVVAGSLGALVGPSFLGIIAESYSFIAGVVILAVLMLLLVPITAALPALRTLKQNRSEGR